MQVLGLVDGVGHHPVIGFEGPAVLGHQRVDHRHRDHLLQALEYPEDQGTMGPGAGQRYVQMIASGLGPEAILPGWPGPAIGGHPVAELGLAADELTLAGFGVVPLVDPFALDQQSHGNTPCLSDVNRCRPMGPEHLPLRSWTPQIGFHATSTRITSASRWALTCSSDSSRMARPSPASASTPLTSMAPVAGTM